MAEKGGGDRSIVTNKKAFHDYHVLQQIEAGLALTGTEIKSVREGRVNIREAYIRPRSGELWLVGAHIAPYASGSYHNHEPYRDRKLLLHRSEIEELSGASAEQGATIVPLRLYLKRGKAKLEIGLVKGKKQYDKRQAIATRDADRAMARAIRSRDR
ncbi:MAG: SsrA-binding protein SmpB [Dehalococcoidia bacterium]|nr:SsrA-binding protein SmpB [Dehalococcoidia bacterium]